MMTRSAALSFPVGEVDREDDIVAGEAANENVEREQRRHLLGTAEMWNERIPAHRIVIANISEHGIGARSMARIVPKINEIVSVLLPGGEEELEGVVCWAKGERFGIQFDRPIRADLYELNHRLRDCADEDESWQVPASHKPVETPGPSGPMRRC